MVSEEGKQLLNRVLDIILRLPSDLLAKADMQLESDHEDSNCMQSFNYPAYQLPACS